MNIVLVTGGRNFSGMMAVEDALNYAKSIMPDMAIVQGGSMGADLLAKNWCLRNDVACFTCHAHWTTMGPKAGPIRNEWMFKYMRPTHVLAFPGGDGTKNAVELANKLGIPVWQP